MATEYGLPSRFPSVNYNLRRRHLPSPPSPVRRRLRHGAGDVLHRLLLQPDHGVDHLLHGGLVPIHTRMVQLRQRVSTTVQLQTLRRQSGIHVTPSIAHDEYF